MANLGPSQYGWRTMAPGTRAVFICGWHSNCLKLTCKGNLGFALFLETPAWPISNVKAITVAPRITYGVCLCALPLPLHLLVWIFWAGYTERIYSIHLLLEGHPFSKYWTRARTREQEKKILHISWHGCKKGWVLRAPSIQTPDPGERLADDVE